jgi:hypothetical protein
MFKQKSPGANKKLTSVSLRMKPKSVQQNNQRDEKVTVLVSTPMEIISDCYALAAGVVPEQTCQVQETRKAGPESNGADRHTNVQRHHAKYVPHSEQELSTLRAPKHYQYYEQVPSGKTLSSCCPTNSLSTLYSTANGNLTIFSTTCLFCNNSTDNNTCISAYRIINLKENKHVSNIELNMSICRKDCLYKRKYLC